MSTKSALLVAILVTLSLILLTTCITAAFIGYGEKRRWDKEAAEKQEMRELYEEYAKVKAASQVYSDKETSGQLANEELAKWSVLLDQLQTMNTKSIARYGVKCKELPKRFE